MEGIATLQDYIRQVAAPILAACHGDLILARSLFLNSIVSSVCDHLPQLRDDATLRAELRRHLATSDVTHFDDERYCKSLSRVPAPPESLLIDSRLIAWAYQLWNDPMRRMNSWAVSHKESRENESASVELITQLFTDDYIADFLARCCYSSQARVHGAGSQIPSVCDPACGGGLLLIAMVRHLVESGQSVEDIGGRLWGFDIDPFVLAVARVALFIEIVRCGYQGDRRALWEGLQRSIRLCRAHGGVLNRDVLEQDVPSAFDIVIANPPYLGRRKLSASLREFLDLHYPAASVDLCAAFIQRCLELARDGGSVGLLTTDKWLRLAGYSSLRDGDAAFPGILSMLSLDLIVELGERAFHPLAALHDGVKASLFCGRKDPPAPSHRFFLGSLARCGSYEDKIKGLRDFESEIESGTKGVQVLQARLKAEGAGAVLLAASGIPSALLSSAKTVRDCAQVVVGTQTSNDQAYIRYVWQVPPSTPGWRVHSKGGGYARWAGLNRWIIDWERGAPIFFKTAQARERAELWIEQRGWSYTWFANGNLGLRIKEPGWSFGRAAASGVFTDDCRLVAYLNSRFASFATRSIGGKAQLPEGVVRKVPAPFGLDAISSELVELAVMLKREIVRTDLADVLYDPAAAYSITELFQIEALLLCVEGLLEAQVESALGLTRHESIAYSAVAGVPVAWFGTESDDVAKHLWSVLPPELQRFRAALQSAAGRMSSGHSAAHVARVSPAGGVLAALKAGPNRSYVLGAVGMVEQLARAMELHPYDVVSQLQRDMEGDQELRRWALLPWVNRQILREILRALGHRWWSAEPVNSLALVGKLSADDTCSLAEDILDRYSARDLLDRPIQAWIEKVFIPWQSRLFYGASPLLLGRNARGRVELFHMWQALDVAAGEGSGQGIVSGLES
jgi:hypothetical protein